MSLSQHRLGHYELQQRLRSDPLSEMWKAFDDQQRRYVVITILRVNPQVAADLISRFQSETQGLTSLHHPNIARVLDVQTSYLPGIADGNAYLVMEYIEGRSLADYLQTTSHKERFPTSVELARLLAPIGAAIDYAHQCGILHGKIKPSNVLLDKCCAPDSLSGEPRLIGFGMRSIQAFHLFPLEDAYYTAPELAQGNMENSRSDIYSLGVILYELCTGTLPFRGDLAMDVIMQHIHTPAPSPALIKPGIQPALTAVIMRCLAKDPVARFPTASTMVGALASALSVSVLEHLRQADSTVGNKTPSLVQTGQDTMNSPTHKSLLSLGLPEGGIPFVPTAGTGLSSPMFPVAQQKPPSPVMPAGGGLTGRSAQTPSEALEEFVRAIPTGQPSVAQTPILPVFTSPAPVQPPAPKTGPSRRWSYTALCVVLAAVVLG
ncbi:MAG TPA: protein kinase, partial [Ktedonobacteraceae bacterium]|nr:protein kinase [Ktedonobacteraceae bacterium]